MPNMSDCEWTGKFISRAVLGGHRHRSPCCRRLAQAAECPRKDALGTSRVLTVDAATTPRVGLKSFPQTLPLDDHEVVLTFDDGPWPRDDAEGAGGAGAGMRARHLLPDRQAGLRTPRTGAKDRAARATPSAITPGPHHNLKYMKPDAATGRSTRASPPSRWRFTARPTTTPSTPFFRFPFFDMTPATLEILQQRGIAVFGADLWASDWNPMTPQQQLKLLTERLQIARKGIILLHDPKAQTAAMLPAFLRYLRDNHYRVVHVVPAGAKTVSGKAH